MAKKSPKPKFFPVDEDDLKPAHRWRRPLMAPGTTQVDFEERVDFRRLHRYRLARTRQSLARSGLGAVLCFDQHNIRYISSTVIGEWARDKLISPNCAILCRDVSSAIARIRMNRTARC